MGRLCCLCGEKPPTALHLFPKDRANLLLWKQICNFEDYDDVSRLRICSNHFTPQDYLEPNARILGGRLHLKPNRIPSVSVPNKIEKDDHHMFCDDHIVMDSLLLQNVDEGADPLQVTEDPEQFLLNIKEEPTPTSSGCCFISESGNSQPSPKKRKFHELRYFGEVSSPDVATPRGAKRAITLARQQINKQGLKIKALQQQNRRLRKKITSLQQLVTRLNSK